MIKKEKQGVLILEGYFFLLNYQCKLSHSELIGHNNLSPTNNGDHLPTLAEP
jgi:hypothetical protein